MYDHGDDDLAYHFDPSHHLNLPVSGVAPETTITFHSYDDDISSTANNPPFSVAVTPSGPLPPHCANLHDLPASFPTTTLPATKPILNVSPTANGVFHYGYVQKQQSNRLYDTELDAPSSVSASLAPPPLASPHPAATNAEDEEPWEELKRILSRNHLSDRLLNHLKGSGQSAAAQLISILESVAQQQLTTGSSADWNGKFQSLIELPECRIKHAQLSALVCDFTNTAILYSQVIINELMLPEEQKTILPIKIGGFAGGEKYQRHGILFKFARDMCMGHAYMYGGEEPDEEAAAKAASNELLGLLAYYGTNVQGLHYPLLAIVDYKGFRMIAASILPINHQTLRYGSDDSGHTVLTQDPGLNQLMAQTGHILNFAEHRSGMQGIAIHSVGDLEGHLGLDGRYYLLDFGRAQGPPESPLQVPTTAAAKRRVFYQLLRPELVRSHPMPLNPDALTMWTRADPNRSEFNREIAQCTLRLHTEVIPAFASTTLLNFHKQYDFVSTQQQISAMRELVDLAHRHGINLRHLGRVRQHLPELLLPTIGKILLHEMLARFFKCVLRSSLRRYTLKQLQLIHQQTHPLAIKPEETELSDRIHSSVSDTFDTLDRMSTGISDGVYKSLAVLHFNLILTRAPGYKAFWAASIDGLQAKYAHSLFLDELDHLPRGIDYRLLIPRLLSMVGFDLTLSRAASHLESDPNNFQFVVSDFPTEIRAVCKQMNVAEQSQGLELLYQALETPQTEVRRRLFELAEVKILQAVSRAPSSNAGLLILGIVLFHRALFSEIYEPGSPQSFDFLKRADLNIREAMALDDKCAFGGLPASYILSLIELKQLTCEQALRDGLSLDKSIAIELQQFIIKSVQQKPHLLSVYLQHLLTLFGFLQDKSCVSSRLVLPPRSKSLSAAEYSSCVSSLVDSSMLWPRMNLRSLNQSNRRKLQVLSAVQLLVDCLHLISVTFPDGWAELRAIDRECVSAIRVDVYILHLLWCDWQGLTTDVAAYRELFHDRMINYHHTVPTAEALLMPTGEYLYGEAALTGDRRLFLIAAFVYSGQLHILPACLTEAHMGILSRLLYSIFELPIALQPFDDATIASWIEQMLRYDLSLFWNLFHTAERPLHPETDDRVRESSNRIRAGEFGIGEKAAILSDSSWFDDPTVLDGKTIRWLSFCAQSDSLRRIVSPLLASYSQLRFALDTILDEQFLAISRLFAETRLNSLSFLKCAGFIGHALVPLHRFSSLTEFSVIDMALPSSEVLLSLATTLPPTLRHLRFPSTQLPCEFLNLLVRANPAVTEALLTLDISNQRALTDEELLATIPTMKSLTCLNLSSCPKLSSATIRAISVTLGQVLTQLTLRSTKGMDTPCLHHISQHLTELQVLDISTCKQLRKESFAFIGGLSNLRAFYLQGCDKIGIDAVATIISQLPKLEFLDLRFVLLEACSSASQTAINHAICQLFTPDKALLPLSLLLGGCRQISAFGLVTALAASATALDFDRLRELDLSSLTSFLPPTSSQQLIKSLNSPGSPRHATEQARSPVSGFSDFFSRFASLSHLSLANLSLSDLDCSGLRYHRQLVKVVLADCRRLTNTTAAVLATLPLLRSLDLRRAGISDQGIQLIAEGCQLIEELLLEGCKILTDVACAHLSQLPRLTKLSLKQCTLITSKGIEQLAPRTAAFSPLKSLILESISPRFNDAGVIHISLRFPLLQELNLAGLIDVTDYSLRMLPLYLLELRYLDISFLPVSATCVQQIVQHGRCLRRIHLVGCPKIIETKSFQRPGLQISVKEATKAIVARVKELAQERNQRIRAEALQEVNMMSLPEIDRVVDEKIIQEVETRCSRSSYAPNTLLEVYSAEKALPVFEALKKKLQKHSVQQNDDDPLNN